jgi:hypothetical protein
MPKLLLLPSFQDSRGSLTVIEKELSFSIERVFYIYDVTAKRGGHGHKHNKLAFVSLNGEVTVTGQSPDNDFCYVLNSPSQCLLLNPEDWHEMSFTKGSILLVLASHRYDKDDYFYEPYRVTQND